MLDGFFRKKKKSLKGRHNKSLATPIYSKHLPDERFSIIDVRTPLAYDKCHIEGAQNITDFAPLQTLIFNNPDQDFLLYCYTGHTVAIYGTRLVEMGAENVYFFDGNFQDLYRAIYGKKGGDIDKILKVRKKKNNNE